MRDGDRISARGAWGQPEGTGGAREEQTLVKTDTKPGKHDNKTFDTKKMNIYKPWRKASRRYALNDLNRAWM